MDFIIQIITSLFRRGQSNLIKIICLAVGLSLGLVLIAKVCFENKRDSHIPHKDRVYLLKEHAKLPNEKEAFDMAYISGGVASCCAAEIPQIEVATSVTPIVASDVKVVVDGTQRLYAKTIGVDTNFFDVFGMEVLVGRPKDILELVGHAMISRSLADKLGGIDNAIGKTVESEENSNIRMVIDGVYEDIPESSTVRADIVTSSKIIGEWHMTNWLGGERFLSYVRIINESDRKEVIEAIRKVQDKYVDPDFLTKANFELEYKLVTVDEWLESNKTEHNLKLLMLFLGIALIVISTVNYLLIVISTLVNRVKEVAVYKCYGASINFLLKMTFKESVLHLSLALLLGAIIVLSIKNIAETLLNASLEALFDHETLIVIALICIVLVIVTTIIPAYIFSKIPVAAAFRNFKESKKKWKLLLLFVQFASTSGIVGLLATVTWQYDYTETIDRGYNYNNLLTVNCVGVSSDRQKTLMAEIRKMAEVEYVSSCVDLPFDLTGNNVFLPEGDQMELFNIGDFCSVSEDYYKTMGVDIVDGAAFDSRADNSRAVMVSEKFVKRMKELGFWEGSGVGKEVCITWHSSEGEVYTVAGVYQEIVCGMENGFDDRPTVMFYDCPEQEKYSRQRYILIRMYNMSKSAIERINELIRENVSEKDVECEPFKVFIQVQLSNERNMRDALLICTIVALIIALLGLYGYTMDEVNRRRREIAIRKVLGTSVIGIMRIISKDITLVAIPALLIGAMAAFYASMELLKSYSVRIDPSVFLYIGIAACIYVVIMLCVVAQLYKAANENPVNNLKAE